ncbi:helix-turn-helix domain-containing protein [Paractinoplanes hotanensis]|nr:helix-turn-helix domain-containing protein [Actinoplanes hotanensis]
MGRWEPNAKSRLRQAAMDLYAERGFDQTTVAEIAERAGLTERTFFRHFTDKREVLFAGSERLHELLVESVATSPLLPTAPAAAEPAAISPAAAVSVSAASGDAVLEGSASGAVRPGGAMSGVESPGPDSVVVSPGVAPSAHPGWPSALTPVAVAFEAAAADYFPPVEYSRQRQRVIDANPPLQERELAKLDRVAAALTDTLRRRGVDGLVAALAAEAGVAAFKVAFTRWVSGTDDKPLVDHVREAFAGLRAMLPAA